MWNKGLGLAVSFSAGVVAMMLPETGWIDSDTARISVRIFGILALLFSVLLVFHFCRSRGRNASRFSHPPNTSMRNALDYMATNSKWAYRQSIRMIDQGMGRRIASAADLRQSAVNGHVTIWGHEDLGPYFATTEVAIEAAYWRRHEINVAQVYEADSHLNCQTVHEDVSVRRGGEDDPCFTSLRVNLKEIQRGEWRKATWIDKSIAFLRRKYGSR